MSCRALQVCLLSACLLAISACSDNFRAPVKSLSTNKQVKAPVAYNKYRVLKGDTLYSIAFRYGLNYQNLASNNKIPAPYQIKPGQVIELNDDYIPYQEVIKPDSSSKPVTRGTTVVKPRSEVAQNQQQRTKNPETKKPVAKPKPGSQFDKQRTVKDWYWPIKSSKTYSRTSENQFIFKVPAGTNVRAVASGRVVYSGTGLVGYGHLIIIKHSNNLLSAYAYNDKVLVKEKQEIKAGQKISTVGKSPTGEVGLGFEIRRRGKPVAIRKYLPL